MAIEKRFIHFKRFSDFNSKKLSANEANTQYTVGVSGAIQNGDPDILYQSYVWIKDTKQQWTHGQLYDGTNLNEAGFLAGEETSDQLDDVETNTYVKYVPQTLTDAQKAQTRINIGAVSGDNFKTINGTSIIGSGDIEISSGEDIRYFTEFTVEQIVQEATLGGALKTDIAELSTAFENNKLICIPYQDSSNGFIIASYEVTLDGNSYLSFIYGTTYYRMLITNLFLNISTHPLSTQTVFVDSGIIDIYDNTTYVVTVPVTSLKIFIISDLSVGSLIRFTVGDDCSFNFYGAPNIMWANGIIPTIESGVTYELSLIRTKIVNSTYTMAILTPFKPVE